MEEQQARGRTLRDANGGQQTGYCVPIQQVVGGDLAYHHRRNWGRLKRAYDTYQNDPRTVNLRLGPNMDYAEAF